MSDIVARQVEVGVDVVNDGEFGHAMGADYDYGPWWTYVFQRLGGLELREMSLREVSVAQPKGSGLVIGAIGERREWTQFREAYGDPRAGVSLPPPESAARAPIASGPITYIGHELIQRDIANMKAALSAAGLADGFLNAVAPASCMRFGNEYYEDDEAMLYAIAEAMREEYSAIIEAGLMLQLDDPAIAENFDSIHPEPSPEAYRRFNRIRVEALNHAIRGLPADRIRFHLCWGSWHGPHTGDLPMAEIVDTMLAVNAGQYSFEAANVRHEHEWRVWREVKLPEGKRILPGVVGHATNVVEHPQVVADRIMRFAEGVGRENVIASTDCGLGGRVHPQIGWAKLESLAAGARLATAELWR